MVNNEWEQFGEEIRRTVEEAVDSRNFTRLNQTINNTIDQAAGRVTKGLQNGGWYWDQPMGQNQPLRQEQQVRQRQQVRQEGPVYRRPAAVPQPVVSPVLYQNPVSARVGGVLLAMGGGLFSALVGLSLFGAALEGILLLDALILTGLFALSFGFSLYGVRKASEVGRFRKYVHVLRGREYCNVSELSQRMGMDEKKTVKDLERMIRKGWFRQGHLDEKGTCFMVTENAWNQYRELMDRVKREEYEKEAARKERVENGKRMGPEVQKILEAGDDYVRRIREANDAIPGREISEKISRMETLVDRIFDRVQQNPGSMDEIGKLMDYYLPTTMKLLEAYQEMDSQPVQGDNIVSSKKEIEMTLDTLNVAFEKLLDDLFQNTAWDLSSDISVLNTILAQEGLKEDGMKKVK